MNTDLSFLNEIKNGVTSFIDYSKNFIGKDITVEHPLDSQIIDKLKQFSLREDDADFEIFRFSKQLEVLWQLLIEKSIKALRYYDGREP